VQLFYFLTQKKIAKLFCIVYNEICLTTKGKQNVMKLTKTQDKMIDLLKSGETKGYNLNSLEALTRKGLVKTVKGDRGEWGATVYTHVVTKGNGWSFKTMEVLETFEKSKQELKDEGWIFDSVYGMGMKLVENK
jgi:hypothetical protein